MGFWKALCTCVGCVAGGACIILSGGTATPLVVGALVGAGGLGGYLVGNAADKEDTEREKMLLQDQRYRDAMSEVNRQIDANNQIKKQITDIEGKLNGTIPRQPNETDEYLKTQLAILTGNLRNGEGRLDGLKSELDKLRKELGGGSSLMSLLGLDKLSFTDKVMIIAAIVLVIWLLKG